MSPMCSFKPPASDSKSGGREVHLVIDGGVCVCVSVCVPWQCGHRSTKPTECWMDPTSLHSPHSTIEQLP